MQPAFLTSTKLGTRLALVGALATGGWIACSGSPSVLIQSDDVAAGGSSTSAGASPATAVNNAATSSNGNGGNGGGGFDFDAGVSGNAGAAGAFEECAGDYSEAEGVGLDMFIVLDHTASMSDVGDCPLDLAQGPSEMSKWCYATHALAQFFVSDAALGHRVALQFMAVEGFVCEGGVDNAMAQAAVGLTTLPTTVDGPLVTALDADDPAGGFGTPIESALRGIETFTVNNQAIDRKMIGILITDGEPTTCSDDPGVLSGIVGDHLTNNGIETYIIGMTGVQQWGNLEAMAALGGAPEHGPEFCEDGADTCHYWSVGDGDPEAFIDALGQIEQAAVLPCVYERPEAPQGETLDYELVNVEFTDSGGDVVELGRVDSMNDCVGDGWYYDDPDEPTALELCPDTCTEVSAQANGANVRISYGCEARIAEVE